MHRSRLSNLVIDCSVEDIDAAAAFWSSALGKAIVPPSADSGDYRELSSKIDEPMILLQKVDHSSRVHLDTGHRFCVVHPQRGPLDATAKSWGDQGGQ